MRQNARSPSSGTLSWSGASTPGRYSASGTSKTLVAFVPTVADGADLCRQFGNIGCESRTGQLPGSKEEARTATRTNAAPRFVGFEDGDTEVLVSVDALGRGFDVPSRGVHRHDATALSSVCFPGGTATSAEGLASRLVKPFACLLDYARNYYPVCVSDRDVR